MSPADRFELEVPARAEHIATARIFTGALGRRLGLDEEMVSDLKLALSEAATMAVDGGAATLRVVAVAGDEGIEIQLGPVGPQPPSDDPEVPSGMDVIGSLFPDSTAEPDDDCVIIRAPRRL